MKTKIVIALFSIVVFAGVAAAQSASAGKTIYASKCSMCHGPDGAANNTMGKNLKIPDFHSPDVKKMSDTELKSIILDGKGKMPAYKGKLTEAQVSDVIAYIHELTK